MGLLHYGYVEGSMMKMGFQSARAVVSVFPDAKNGDVVRHNHQPWRLGAALLLVLSRV